MATVAEGYLEASDTLNRKTENFGQSAVLLRTIGFEILLKATYLIDQGKEPKFSHDYEKGFYKLSERTRSFVIEKGMTRYFFKSVDHSEQFPDLFDEVILKDILKDFSRNFLDGRYEYEAQKGLSDVEVSEKENKWIESSCPDNEAEFRFYPEEMKALCFGLQSWIENQSSLDDV